MFKRNLALLVAAAAASLTPWTNADSPADASDAGDVVADLRQTVAAMQQRIDQLESAQDADWLTEARAEEIQGLVTDILQDADTRTSLQAGGPIAGWDDAFFLGSPDGEFLLKIGGQIQTRFVYNSQDESPVDDNRSGFEMRRLRLFFWGHVVDPSWTYDIQINADRSDGAFFLEDYGYIQKDFDNGWQVRFGQMKAPYLREELLSSRRMLAIERTLVNSEFTAGTVQGIQLMWGNEQFRAAGMFHDGNGSANTAWNVEDTEYAFSARGEWLLAGDWGQFNDWTGFPNSEFGVLLGAAVNYSVAEYGTGMGLPAPDFNNAELENLGFTVDATIDCSGASFGAAVIFRKLESDTGAASDVDADQFGLFVRGGYFLNHDWEVFGQYEWADADMSGVEDLSVVTVGATRYWNRHNLKWTNDIGFGLNEVDPIFENRGAGWRDDADDQDGQIVFRSQFQLVF